MQRHERQLNEYDNLISNYFDRHRLQRELRDFYTFTSFSSASDIYKDAIHIEEFPAFDGDDSVGSDASDWDELEQSVCSHAMSVPLEKKTLNSDSIPELMPASPTSSAPSKRGIFHDIHKDESSDCETLIETDVDADVEDSSNAHTRRTNISYAGTRGSGPSTLVTGISYSSDNSSISELKLKKRNLERSYEKKFPRFPTVVELPSRTSLPHL